MSLEDKDYILATVLRNDVDTEVNIVIIRTFTKKKLDDLRCQIGTTNFSKTRALPYAFTEQGVYMLATVINCSVAIEVSKSIMRTFTNYSLSKTNHKTQIKHLFFYNI